MNFDLSNIGQSYMTIEEKLFYPMYNNLHKASQNNFQIRYIAPLIGAADGLISLAQAVATIGEATIKGPINIFGGLAQAVAAIGDEGSINIFGSFVFNSCNYNKGFFQIIFQVPAIGLTAILSIPIRIIKITIGFFNNPEQLCADQSDLISSKLKNKILEKSANSLP
ncbi:MAG: hypothetical protein KR126chlam6_01322 [Candidatus Anoxychlamydiales bacterium]|nr:hypothetical protein [Candidatus Anoxychlamydiales bacterium]